MTPKELMISRYEAFVRKDWEYVAKTSTHQTLEDLSIESDIEWLKLEVLNTYENTVEFKAYYKEHGEIGVLHEKSLFIEEDGQLKYASGELFQSKILRNETCPCGSGKKYKKCCMKV